jgi:hypothetical protein
MLVLAMEFSRCARGAARNWAGAGSPDAGEDPKGRPRATLRPIGPQRVTGGCPFKTEQKDPDLGESTRSEETATFDGRAGLRLE